MGAIIKKIWLQNFKRFRNYVITPNEHVNIFVGDNEVGKSSVLEAIDIVASGNIRRVEAFGMDRLLNIDAVREFLQSDKQITKLPILRIELYLEGSFDHTMNGKNNVDRIVCDGIRLICEPNMDYITEIKDAMAAHSDYFPYDYYTVRFSTFADEPYTGYRKKMRCTLIDSTRMNTEYATNDFVKRMYHQYTDENEKERAVHKSQYRQMRTTFRSSSLSDLNSRVPSEKNYAFGLRNSSSLELENDLMIYEDEVGIDSKGTGKQVFIKTDFALEHSGENVDVILIEEPENHLSPVNLRKLVQRVASASQGQLFITTHSSMISTRLEVNNLLIMAVDGNHTPTMLKDLSEETAKYFSKTPPANIVEFSLAKKVILVEGPAEFMLMEKFFVSITDNTPEELGIHIIDVRGLSFKRYLEISKLTGSKVAVVTDNDSDYQKHCVDKYAEYSSVDNVEVFYDNDNQKRTFEVVLYHSNKELCERLFSSKNSDVVAHMTNNNNKTEVAFTLLSQNESIEVPNYIKRAIDWIRK